MRVRFSVEHKRESKVSSRELIKENKVLKRGFFILYNRFNVVHKANK